MKYSIALISFILLLGCTKFGKTYRVKGRVLNPVTGQGIQGAEVRIYKNTMELPGGSKMQKSAITDSEGNFDMSKLAFRTDKISVYSFPGEYYPIGWTQNNGQSFDMPALKMGKTMHADFYAVSYGNLILNINNVNCSGAGDVMNFHKKWVGFTDFENSYSSPREGCYSYTSPYPFQIPIGTYVYETKVVRSGITSFVYDTVTVAETGVSTINIDY